MDITKKFYEFGDMTVLFFGVDGTVRFVLMPHGTEIDEQKLLGISPLGHMIDREPMLHIALSGDGFTRDFTAGNTLRNADTAYALALCEQTLEEDGGALLLRSVFRTGKGLIATNYLRYVRGKNVLTVWNELENEGEEVCVEALPSFNISGITPYGRVNRAEKHLLHKLISNWSGEGKLYSVSTDKLAFEPSWSGLGIRSEIWKQTGSMPARGQLPFVALEDTENNITWAAAIEAPASWVIETTFRNGSISLGGGRGDFLTAHWKKKLRKGEKLVSDRAFLTVVRGGLEEACHRLVSADESPVKDIERDLPLIFNEYCYSWGSPTEDNLLRILPVAKRMGCRYFVVDDGWFSTADGGRGLGDWAINTAAFPRGLKHFARAVRAEGLIPGVWYEFESVTDTSALLKTHPEYLLTLHGKPIEHYGRYFLDFRKPEVISYLREKVINTLKENEIGYMKVDYNDNIGVGADGGDSLGDALREHIDGVLAFFREIKRELPDLVLEVCSSGGMRHEPTFLSLADMVSFSDAHENPAGVNVACNLHRYIPPRKMQIWATIRKEYTVEDVAFTASKAMLGRYCLSGDLADRSEEVLAEIERSVSFYQSAVVPVLLAGKTVSIRDEITSYLHPVGRTVLVRESEDGERKLVYAFAMNSPRAEFRIAAEGFSPIGGYHVPETAREGEDIVFRAADCAQWGCVLLLGRDK